MEIKTFVTEGEHIDLQFPAENEDQYCIRFGTNGNFIHAKLHSNPKESMESREISTQDLEKFLAKSGSSLSELKTHLK